MLDDTLGTYMACHLNAYVDAQSIEIVEQTLPYKLDMHEASPASVFVGVAEGALSDPCDILNNEKTSSCHADMQGAFVSHHGAQRFSHTRGTHDLVAPDDVSDEF